MVVCYSQNYEVGILGHFQIVFKTQSLLKSSPPLQKYLPSSPTHPPPPLHTPTHTHTQPKKSRHLKFQSPKNPSIIRSPRYLYKEPLSVPRSSPPLPSLLLFQLSLVSFFLAPSSVFLIDSYFSKKQCLKRRLGGMLKNQGLCSNCPQAF